MSGAEATSAPLARLRAALTDPSAGLGAVERLAHLTALGLDQLPLPGRGQMLQRWQALAAVAQADLSLVKLYEGHTDALAILSELGTMPQADARDTWGMWAAEAPQARAMLGTATGDEATLNGTKAWCSGARGCARALLTAWYPDGRGPQLVQINIRQPGVSVRDGAWQSVGMAGSASLDVFFHGAQGCLVGEVGDYLQRPGFWHGGAGIAACWYGGSLAVASALHAALDTDTSTSAAHSFKAAALGKVDLALQGTAALLRLAAQWIDQNPEADARAVALRVRQSAETTARLVLDEVGRALGATPYCRDAHFARAAADLPVFIRQSHAERDFAALGEQVQTQGATAWQL